MLQPEQYLNVLGSWHQADTRSHNPAELVEQTPHWKPLWPGKFLPIQTKLQRTKTVQSGQNTDAWSCQSLTKVLPKVFPKLYKILIILGKWQHIPAVLLTIAPYFRHVLDPSLNPDLLLRSLSIWLHFLALVSATLITWELLLWRFWP